jgi:ComF family protein
MNRQDLAGVLGPLLASAFWATWFRKDVDLIVPVPLHAERERNRGFNQSALLAAELSRFLALPWKKNILRRIRNTKPQVGLSDTQRRVNMKNAFHCRDPRIVQDRRLLLIDDVMTTGATAASAAQALLQAGALRVSVLTAARTLAGFE